MKITFSNIEVLIFCISFFLLFPVCVSYQLWDPFITPRVILVSICITILAVFSISKKSFLSLPFTPLAKAIVFSFLAFLLLRLASVMKSINPGDALFDWLKTFSGFGVMLFSIRIFRNKEQREILLKFSQVSILVLTAVYIYQWIYFLNNIKLELVFDLKLHTASTLGNKNFYGEVICLFLPFTVISYFSTVKIWKFLSGINLLILATTIILTQSFAAIFACVVAVPCSILLLLYSDLKNKGSFPYNKIFSVKTISVAVLLLAGLGYGFYKTGLSHQLGDRLENVRNYMANPERLDSTTRANSNSTFERIMLWRNSVYLFKENPLTGCGAGNWKLLYPKFGIRGTYYIEGGNVHYEHPHNDFLLVLSESGIVAAAAFLLFLILLAVLAMRGARADPGNKYWYAGLLFAVIGFAILSQFSFPRVRFYAWILFCILAGLLVSINISKAERAGTKSFLDSKLFIASILGIAIWILYASLVRYVSETHSKDLQVAKKNNNFARMAREAEKANSFYFPVDELATPFTWHTGMALFMSGNVPGAKAAYEDAIGKNPYHIQLINDLATCYEQTDEREKAVALYKRSLEISPLFVNSILNLSACYFNMNNIDSAYIMIDKVHGIRLDHQQKKNYAVFLPAILRAKISIEASLLPDSLKEEISMAARKDKLLTAIYKESKARNSGLVEALLDSIHSVSR